ncbi:MAG: HAD hydrolase-like protein [Candidatus Curtissbacteria bacterium]|nr:HAD hydrolase-like protein [Candidatus Curtissbacteria bacterium]
MIKLVAFDWNGTILSDTVACLVGDDAALVALGYKPISLKKFQETFEVPLVNFYTKIGVNPKIPKAKLEKSETIFHETYEARAANSRTRAGTRSLLKWLKAHNIPSVIFSNHIRYQIIKHLKRLKIEEYFAEVIGNGQTNEIIFNRGKGEKLMDYLKAKKINPAEILIVGDTVEEIEIARELGAIAVAITNGYNSTKRLKDKKPDYLLNDLRKIEGIIVKINKT